MAKHAKMKQEYKALEQLIETAKGLQQQELLSEVKALHIKFRKQHSGSLLPW